MKQPTLGVSKWKELKCNLAFSYFIANHFQNYKLKYFIEYILQILATLMYDFSKDVRLPVQLQRAMAAEAEAAREARAKVISNFSKFTFD